MADTSTRVQGPVSVKTDSAERVAYDLYMWVRDMSPENQDKELELFARCLYHTKEHYQPVAKIKKIVQGN